MKKCTTCNKNRKLTNYGICSKTISRLRAECNFCRSKKRKDHYQKNKVKVLKQTKIYKENHKEFYNQYQREYQKTSKFKKYLKKYTKKNKERIKKYQREWNKKQRAENPLFKLAHILRIRLSRALKSKKWSKNSQLITYLGCSLEELKQHLESKFQSGMTWENHGYYGWHVDHIIPIDSAIDAEHMHKLCHYTNLQPLWRFDNQSKGDKCPIK